MTTDHDAAIAAAEARLAEAQADVERLRAQLAAEQPRKSTWEDGVAAARRRHPGRTRSETAAASREARPKSLSEAELNAFVTRTPAAAYTEKHGLDITTVEGAKAEARHRGAARKAGNQ
jgi:hypothetical protein